MKRILTLILLFALILSFATVGTAFADTTSTVVSEGERVTLTFKEGDYGGYFGTKEKISISSGESVYMEFDLHDSIIPPTNYNLFVVPTTYNLNANVTDYVDSSATSFFLYSNWAYGTPSGTEYATEKDFQPKFGSTVTVKGTLDPTKVLIPGVSVRYEYTYETGNKSSYVVYHKPIGANEAAYTPVFEMRNISDTAAATMQSAYFEFCINGGASSINSNQGNFTLEFSNYKVADSRGNEYNDPAIFTLNNRTKWDVDNTVPEGTDDKALNLVSNNTGLDSHVAYYFNYSRVQNAEIKFSVPKGDSALSVLLDMNTIPLDGSEVKMAIPADVENFKLVTDAQYATLYNADTGAEIAKENMMFGALVNFAFALENNATFTKNVFIDDIEIKATDASSNPFEYKYGFNDGLANYFTAVSNGKGNFAQVHDSVYTVTFYYVDGTVIDTQVVGYGNNANIPEIVSATDPTVAGEFADFESVKKQATFIDSDRGIYVERVDDDIDYIVVFVDGGILSDGNASMITRAGSTITATLGTVPTGYKFTGWMIDGEYVDNDPTHTTYTFVANQSTQLVAKFENIVYKVKAVGGKIIAVNGVECSLSEVDAFYGDEIKVLANELDPILNPGEFYVGWYIGDEEVTNSNQYWFNVAGDTEIVAKTAKEKINVSISNGHWNGQSTGIVVNYGTEIVAIPNAASTGYRFAYWMVNNVRQEDVTGDTSLRYEATEDLNIIAVFEPLSYNVTIVGGTVDGEVATNKAFEFGTEISIQADDKAGYTFAGWYDEDDNLVYETASTFITVDGNITLTAKYTEGTGSGCGCGCGSMTDGGNGGMWTLFGLLAIFMAIVMLVRRGAFKRFAKSAMVLVLAVAVVGGVMLSGAPVELSADVDKTLSLNDVKVESVLVSDTESDLITVESEAFAIDIPTALFDIADKVIVSMDVYVDATSDESTKQNDYSTLKLYSTNGVLVDDALPVGKYQTVTFESQVLMKNGAFVVELIVKDGLNAKIKYKNAVLVEDDLADELLAGTTMWMMPTWAKELTSSFVIESSSGELIVIDGGSANDAKYLVNFLYTRGVAVDHWFVSNYSASHIGALANILKNDLITVNNVYYNLPDVADTTCETLMANLSKTNAVEITAGQVIEMGDVKIKALNDTQNFDPEGKNENYNFAGNSSIVYRMDTLGESVLFLSDAGAELGNYLLENCAEDITGCEIIQTAGHSQNGVGKEVYEAIGGRVYLNNISRNAWYADAEGTINSSKEKLALTTREWFRELGVVRNKCSFNGIVTIK